MANFNRTIATPLVVVNNQPILIIPNSLTFTEGLGEQNMRTQSGGGNTISMVTSVDATSKFSEIKFQLAATAENITLIRIWKTNGFSNAVSFSDEGLTRYGSQAGITNNYEVKTGADGVIDVEFKCSPLV